MKQTKKNCNLDVELFTTVPSAAYTMEIPNWAVGGAQVDSFIYNPKIKIYIFLNNVRKDSIFLNLKIDYLIIF